MHEKDYKRSISAIAVYMSIWDIGTCIPTHSANLKIWKRPYEHIWICTCFILYYQPNENSYLNILGKLNQNAFWCRAIHFLQYHLFLTWCSNIIHINIIVLCNMQLAPNCAFKPYSIEWIQFHFILEPVQKTH